QGLGLGLHGTGNLLPGEEGFRVPLNPYGRRRPTTGREPEGGRRLHPPPSYRKQGGHRHRGRVRAGGGCCVWEGYPRYVRHRQEEREINRNPDNSQDLDEDHEQIGVGPRDRKGPEISEGEAGPDRRGAEEAVETRTGLGRAL